MKKKLKSDLVSLANQILKLDSDSDYKTLKLHAQKVYEALAILVYIEAHYDEAKPTTDKADIIDALEKEDSQLLEQSVQETQEIPQESSEAVLPVSEKPVKEETDSERISRIAAANEELFERVRKPQEPEAKPKEKPEERINQASLYEPVMEKIKDMVAQMPPEADAIEDMFQQITKDPKYIKNDKDDIGEFGKLAEFEEQEKPLEKQTKKLNDRISRGLSFGLNDRIAFIKNLFNGNTQDYQRVLSQLNTTKSQEEAFNLIDQMIKPDYNYWEGKEVYEMRFKELVARKFD